MTTEEVSANTAAPDWDEMTAVLGIAAYWAWEQDTEFRFTRLAGQVVEGDADFAIEQLLGSTRWGLGLEPVDGAPSWDAHREVLSAQQAFSGLVLWCGGSKASARFVSISGAPSYDQEGRWTGYRGFGRDVTDIYQGEQTVQRLEAIMGASPECIFVSDVETHRLLYVNDTACELTGFAAEELLKIPGYKLTGRTREEADQAFKDAIAGGVDGVTDQVHFTANRDGTRKGWWEPHHRSLWLDGRWIVVTSSREVSGRVLAEQGLRRAKRMYAALSATSDIIMRAGNANDLYQGVCDAAVEAGGLASAAILLAEGGRDELRVAAIAGAGKKQIHQTVISIDPARPEGNGLNGIAFRSRQPCVSNDFLGDPRTKAWHGIAKQMRLKAGASIPLLREGKSVGVLYLSAGERRTFDDEAVHLLQQMAHNLAFGLQNLEHRLDRERAEERVRYLATHDSLTGLPNRALFGELLDQSIAMARRNKQSLAVMFIDLDRFKLVNDTLGHAAGDILLKEMSSRLRGVLRDSDVLARIGGDEFVILLPNITQPGDAAIVARKLLDASLVPVTILEQECRVTASIGISVYPTDGEGHAELMKSADTAMYLSKEKGKNTFEFFVPGMQSQSHERLALETGLRNAIANNELYLHYQAKLDLKTDAITGVEALLRWEHPTLGNITPQRFLPLCEDNGSIVPIGRWVLNTACRQNVAWQRQGLPAITMAVNLSARQFTDPDLLSDVRSALKDSGMDPALLELELTESMVMLNPSHTVKVLGQLHALGVRIAVDDFGVGYSSLAQIRDFPIDTLKVDRSFIRNLPESTQDRAIAEAIISMARSLNLRVIAEGVETEAQEAFLRGLSCDESQGFYFSKPASPEAFSSLLKSHGVESDSPSTSL